MAKRHNISISKSNTTRDLKQKWQITLFAITIILGIFFRFQNLDLKPYWHDEVYTSLRISGYRSREAVTELSNKIISPQEIRKYQCPSQNKNLNDTVRTLILDDPQHPPLFYCLEALWTRIWGCSVTSARSLAALLDRKSTRLNSSHWW